MAKKQSVLDRKADKIYEQIQKLEYEQRKIEKKMTGNQRDYDDDLGMVYSGATAQDEDRYDEIDSELKKLNKELKSVEKQIEQRNERSKTQGTQSSVRVSSSGEIAINATKAKGRIGG